MNARPTRWVDLAAVTVLLAVGVQAFGPVFGGTVGYLAAGGGVLVGLGLAVLSAVRGWSKLGTLVGGMTAYLLLGGAIALPGSTVLGVVPTLETLQRLVVLSWQSWRDLLTVSLPAGEFDGPAVLPYLTGLVAATLAGGAALRLRRVAWALAPALALLTVGILWGSHDAPLAAAQGAVFALTALAWLAWRSQTADPDAGVVFRAAPDTPHAAGLRAARLRQAGLGAAVLAVAGLLGATLAPLAGAEERHVLRDDVEPPLDLQAYPSPLTLFRHLETTMESEPLLTVTGLPEGARVRLAAMDVYDGNVYDVSEWSALFAHAGETIVPGPWSDPDAPVDEVTVEVDGYRGVWLPGGGDLRGVEFEGSDAEEQAAGLFHNPATGTALTTARVTEGSRYTVRLARVPAYDAESREALPAEARVGDITMAPNLSQVEAVTSKVGELTGDAATPMDQLRSIEKALARGFYANGTRDESLAGHTVERIRQLLEDPSGQMVGDDEQYAVAMALMGRHLGLPARVVMGFYPEEPAAADTPLTLTGDDAHVWVEVLFDELGWVPFDPTPDEDNRPDQQRPQPLERNDPQVLPPPEVPEERQPKPPARADSEEVDRELEEDGALWTVLRWVGLGLGGVLLLLSPFALVVLAKLRRRGARLRAARPADRVSGGWAELADTCADLGTPLPAHATRRESAATLAHGYALPAAETEAVAHRVDAHVFGPQEPAEDEVRAVWADLDDLRGRLLAGVPLRRRLAARVSTRSLLRPSDRHRSPRVRARNLRLRVPLPRRGTA